MTPKEFKKYLARDGHCLHCGVSDDTLVPQHRANRGHGGSKKSDTPANIIVFCSYANGLIESNPHWANAARMYGWKISRYDDPTTIPVRDMVTGMEYLLDDKYGRNAVETFYLIR